jgi:hypothetical protein
MRPLGPFDIVIADPVPRTHPTGHGRQAQAARAGTDMVPAARRSPIRSRMAATTVETVRFERPETVDFGSCPLLHVGERVTFNDDGGLARVEYGGELGTDF